MGSKTTPCCKIGPSILNADLANLGEESERLLDSGADYLHLDVMDGKFVPNITFGAPVVKCLRRRVHKAFFDMHMMVAEPEKWVTDMFDAGCNQYTFHIEATSDPAKLIRQIKETGMQVGIGVKPKTDVDVVLPYVEQANMILIMTVEPGFGGQKFMSDMMPKVKKLRGLYPDLDIEVDGGVGPANIDIVGDAGANMIVSGTAIVKSEDPRKTICELRSGVEKFIVRCVEC